jgi:hypothetical protein
MQVAAIPLTGRKKVVEVTKDLESDSYAHVTSGIQVVTAAATAFILQNVTNPPPQLFLRDPNAYRAQVNSAGGLVLLYWLRYTGFVASVWQFVGRAGGGPLVRKLVCYSFHCFRSVAHKVSSVEIAMICLMGLCCAYPPLQDLLLATCSVSMLGRTGRNMWFDRLLECINWLQQQRMNAFTGFFSGLHYTQLLAPMLHVDHAFQDARHGGGRATDHFTPSMVFEAAKLQRMFLRRLGTDLTVNDPNNPFWWTGTPTPLSIADFRKRMPWLWVWRSASGVSAGSGRTTRKAWDVYVREWIQRNPF